MIGHVDFIIFFRHIPVNKLIYLMHRLRLNRDICYEIKHVQYPPLVQVVKFKIQVVQLVQVVQVLNNVNHLYAWFKW